MEETFQDRLVTELRLAGASQHRRPLGEINRLLAGLIPTAG